MNARYLIGGWRTAGVILSSAVLVVSASAQQPALDEQAPAPVPAAETWAGEVADNLIETAINLGDDAFGIIDGGGEIHRFTFQAVVGTELYIRGERQQGLMQLPFELRAPSGEVLVTPIDSIKTPNVAKKKHIMLQETGTYTLDFMDLLNNGGTYTMRTIPDWPQRTKGLVVVDGASPAAPVVFDGVAGSTIRKLIVRTPKAKGIYAAVAGQPANLEPMPLVRAPSGAAVDFGENIKIGKDNKRVVAWKVPLPEIGSYAVEIDGQEETVGFARVLVKARFPKGGTKHNIND